MKDSDRQRIVPTVSRPRALTVVMLVLAAGGVAEIFRHTVPVAAAMCSIAFLLGWAVLCSERVRRLSDKDLVRLVASLRHGREKRGCRISDP